MRVSPIAAGALSPPSVFTILQYLLDQYYYFSTFLYGYGFSVMVEPWLAEPWTVFPTMVELWLVFPAMVCAASPAASCRLRFQMYEW